MTEGSSSWIGRDLPPIVRDGREYFLVGSGGELFLVENRCPHRGGALKFGFVDAQERIVCPLHKGAFPIASLLAQPTTLKLTEGVSR
ncbi:hypothetical protein BH10PSE1_BH10PSE1_23530 [soil metagenome]